MRYILDRYLPRGPTQLRPTLMDLPKGVINQFLDLFGVLPLFVAMALLPSGPSLSITSLYLPLVAHTARHNPSPPANARATWSSPIALSPSDGSIWTVNPDSNTVTVLQAQSFDKIAEIPTGEEPWSVALTADSSQVIVANRASGTLTFIDGTTHATLATVAVGTETGGVVLTPDGHYAVVTLMTEGAVVFVDLQSREVVQRIPVNPVPYALAVDEDSSSLYVTHLIAQPYGENPEARDDGRQSSVTVIDVASAAVVKSIPLLPNLQGSPNRLTSITLLGNRAWLPQVRDAPALPNGLTTTLFAAVMSLDLAKEQEDPAAFIPLNDQEIFGSPVNNPTMAVPSPDGKRLYVVLAGSDLVEVIDISKGDQPKLIKFLAVGRNPQGLALNNNGTQGYVMNFLDRSVTVLELDGLNATITISTTEETLAPKILQGKILFNTAIDPRLAQSSWLSCASCHFEGLPDGVTWIFPDGPRQTPSLWEAGATLPWHWSAALDEAQDVEDTIHVIQRGVGLAPGLDPPLLGIPNKGRSSDLDALADFLMAGLRTPAIAPTAFVPTAKVDEGRALFASAGCTACHGGAHWTTSALPGPAGSLDPDGNGMVDGVLQVVDTLNPLDVRGASGFDPPSLLGVGMTAPYLHDGSMVNLEALLAAGHPNPKGGGNHLSTEEIAMLSAFLHSIGPDTSPIEMP